MGSLFAGYLSPWADLVMIGRWPAQLTALRERGLTIRQPDGRQIERRVRATSDLEEAGTVDLALLLVKSNATAQAAAQAGQILSPDGLALTLQNGLNNWRQLVKAVGEERAGIGVTTQGATLLSPGLALHAGHGPTYLGRRPALASRLVEARRLFQKAGLETHLSDDIDSLIWGKLAVNAAINPLTALLRVPNGYLVEQAETRVIVRAVAQEVAAVARRLGIKLPYADPGEQALKVAQATAANYSSMAQDVMRGTPTEIEAINGAVVAAARRLGLAAPLNEKLLYLISQVDEIEPASVLGRLQ